MRGGSASASVTRPWSTGIDLRVPRGGCFGLLGPNGAGKTTTLRMILGRAVPSGGKLTVLGEPMPAAGRRVRARIGVVPQDDNLDSRLHGGGEPAGLRRLLPAPGPPALAALPHVAPGIRRPRGPGRRPGTGPVGRHEAAAGDRPRPGERTPSCSSSTSRPPASTPQIRHLIWSRLRELKDRGTTVLLTTHYMEEAERLCDRLAIIDRGRILAEDTPRALVAGEVEPSVVEVRAGARTPPPEIVRQGPGGNDRRRMALPYEGPRTRCWRASSNTPVSNTCTGPRTWRTCSCA